MRSVHKMYKVVREDAQKKQRDVQYGICHLIQDAKYADSNELSVKEEEALKRHLHKLRPTRDPKHPFSSFAYNKDYKWSTEENKPVGSYWWKNNEGGKKQRLLLLEALIMHTRPWYIKIWDKIWWI